MTDEQLAHAILRRFVAGVEDAPGNWVDPENGCLDRHIELTPEETALLERWRAEDTAVWEAEHAAKQQP